MGIQDITAHVDFTVLAEAALPSLMVAGFTHQAAFLLNCGIASFMPSYEDQVLYYTITHQIKKLTLPSEMGELFKIIALTKNYQKPLLGFTYMNQTERLACLVLKFLILFLEVFGFNVGTTHFFFFFPSSERERWNSIIINSVSAS